MKFTKKGFYLIVLALLMLVCLNACGVVGKLPFMATATPYPTFTAFPTYTPYPTFTPLPTKDQGTVNWSVKIISRKSTLTYAGWQYDLASNGRFLILTVQYTNNSSKIVEFYPKSVLLLYENNPSYPGEAIPLEFYKSQDSQDAVDFATSAPLIIYVQPGQTRTDVFGWGLSETDHTEFMLLFPQTTGIPFTVTKSTE